MNLDTRAARHDGFNWGMQLIEGCKFERNNLLVDIHLVLFSARTVMLNLLQLVAGSAIQAFEEVCPERIDLIHKNYRKLCNLLVDVEEWGQVVIINMLTRYCRMQFVNPNQAVRVVLDGSVI